MGGFEAIDIDLGCGEGRGGAVWGYRDSLVVWSSMGWVRDLMGWLFRGVGWNRGVLFAKSTYMFGRAFEG